jgi:hypothetical protein
MKEERERGYGGGNEARPFEWRNGAREQGHQLCRLAFPSLDTTREPKVSPTFARKALPVLGLN